MLVGGELGPSSKLVRVELGWVGLGWFGLGWVRRYSLLFVNFLWIVAPTATSYNSFQAVQLFRDPLPSADLLYQGSGYSSIPGTGTIIYTAASLSCPHLLLL